MVFLQSQNSKFKIQNLKLIFTLLLTCSLFFPALAQAKPEVMALKSPEIKTKQKMAKQNLKQIDLQKIEDPEARKAIKEILRYLRLTSKNES